MDVSIEQPQTPKAVAEITSPRSVGGAITDGSQVIAHDGYDVESFQQAAEDYDRLASAVEGTVDKIRTGEELTRDVFWSFLKSAPRAEPVAPLSPAHEINQQIIDQIMSTTEWRELREGGTVGDPLLSATATIWCAASAVAALDQETIQRLNQLHELSDEIEQLFASAEVFDELADKSHWGNSEKLKSEAAKERDKAENKQQEAKALAKKLKESAEDCAQKVRLAVRRGLAEALAEVERANEAINAFAGGYGPGFGTQNGSGGRNSLNTKEKITIAQHVGRSPKLRQIAAVCGRFTRIAMQQQKIRVKHPPDEITSITTGSSIERLLPSEMALLTSRALEDLFLLRFAENGLMQYDLVGHEPQGQGPIIIAMDESGSMKTNYGGLSGEVWSKAVMLALLSIARLQKRDMAVIHFSGINDRTPERKPDLRLDLFQNGAASAAEVITCAEFFFNGGTVFEPWMRKALELVDGSQFKKADVICVSDGISKITSQARAEWAKRRERQGMRVYSILIGGNQGESLLNEISDTVFRLDDLRGDLPALEVIFSSV